MPASCEEGAEIRFGLAGQRPDDVASALVAAGFEILPLPAKTYVSQSRE
jgi:hypothetical protein